MPEYTVHRDPDGHITYAAGLIGDEAVLYHGRRIPVVIDGDRVRGAEAAARLFAPTHILIDDGFQNHRICKDVDILLLDARRPFGDGRLLPAGTLRERADVARRADVVIFTRAVDDTVPAGAADIVRGKPLFFARHSAVEIMRRGESPMPPSWLLGRSVALYSGIARPESFEEIITRTGAEPIISFRFIDHHTYRPDDISRMLDEAPPGIPFVTTEKDWVKSEHLFPGDREVCAVLVRMELRERGSLANLV